ncbi:hypothetical protein J437_LFUL018022, partial [Ladona fulva]
MVTRNCKKSGKCSINSRNPPWVLKMDMAETGEVSVKEEKEDLMDFSEEYDVSGGHAHEMFVKVGNEDSLDVSYERSPSDAQIDETFIKTEEEDPLDVSDAEDFSEGQLN